MFLRRSKHLHAIHVHCRRRSDALVEQIISAVPRAWIAIDLRLHQPRIGANTLSAMKPDAGASPSGQRTVSRTPPCIAALRVFIVRDELRRLTHQDPVAGSVPQSLPSSTFCSTSLRTGPASENRALDRAHQAVRERSDRWRWCRLRLHLGTPCAQQTPQNRKRQARQRAAPAPPPSRIRTQQEQVQSEGTPDEARRNERSQFPAQTARPHETAEYQHRSAQDAGAVGPELLGSASIELKSKKLSIAARLSGSTQFDHRLEMEGLRKQIGKRDRA